MKPSALTPAEIREERRLIIETRLAILGVIQGQQPTPIQLKIATDEADEWEAVVMGVTTGKRKQ